MFDWDGTAVADRRTPVPGLARALERLLGQGVRFGIVTGTKLESVGRILFEFLPKESRSGLFVCTNRGSEVWSFSETGEAVPLHRYEASAAENQALDRIARACRESLARQGVVAEVVADRLNRRKLDLIPLGEWRDPEKSRLRELAAAVEERLRRNGFAGGIPAVLKLARDAARGAGLPGAKITSDLKHVEIGLTDKSDSIRWLIRNVFSPNPLLPNELAIFGDEFGTIGGVRGSDALMQVPGMAEFPGLPELPELEEATFVSVGAEPGGVPEGVLRLGGGPPRFQEFLDYQDRLRRAGGSLLEGLPSPTPDPSWLIEQEGFDPSREDEMESLFALGNGYAGVRGSSDLPIPSSQAEFYLAGIYDRKAAGLAYSEPEFRTDDDRPDHFSEIVPFPSPYRFRVRADGLELTPGSPEMRGHERILDLKKGLLFELFYFAVPRGRTVSLRLLRAVSLVDAHLLLHEVKVQVEGGTVELELEAEPGLADFSLRFPHLTRTNAGGFVTSVSRFQGFIAARRALDGVETRETPCRMRAEPGRPAVLRSQVSVFSSRDEGAGPDSARAHLATRSWAGFDQELASHIGEWKAFWRRADIRFAERPAVTQAFRFGLHQLRGAAPRTAHASMGARGLTGRSYEGHVFWDAEIFAFPFYLFAVPEAARNILLYRFRTLPGAKARAAGLGCRGACFAWESTVDGADVTPPVIVLRQARQRVPIYTGRQQIHVTADIAFAVSEFWRVTGDDAFMKDCGAELLAETARFWASRVSERDGRFHLLGVVGPDEYHHDVDDNAYTNWMARLNLEKAASCLGWLASRDPAGSERLRSRLGLRPEEIEAWKNIARLLYFPEPGADGVIEQFAGFFRLAEARIGGEERLRAPVNRLLHWEEVNRLRLIKQADVLMIPFLFPEAWPREVVESNYRYYAPLTDHGSSLSPGVHAAIAADIGRTDEANRFWEEALNLDLQNLMRNTALGIHLGCMGGVWQALVFHFQGLRQEGARLVERRPREGAA